ncbi:WD G-beta repeat containing protein, putative [Babesia ovis]|uniref:WD G-beta repeat containing protein, putative n=1 Tax=Babesia ovis TaxID=5869 RepID=A0A9W5T9R0_BABOV|nr:WD G-beta repeat containing protein, putative [Babesia ovis]
MPRYLKSQVVSLEALRLKSKVKDLCYNCNGSRLFIASREGVNIFDAESLSPYATLSTKSIRVLTHPTSAEIFALLVMEGADNPRPCVKVYSLPSTVGASPLLMATVWSGFDDTWYSGAWSLDGSTIAVVDRSDRLQRVGMADLKDSDMDPSTAISLQSEVYGLVYTSNSLVIQKVDGTIDILDPGFGVVSSEQLHSHIVLAAAYNPSRDILATGGSDHTVHLTSCKDDYTCFGTFSGIEGKVSCVSISSDGLLLAWGTKDSLYMSTEDGNNAESTPVEEYYLTVAGTDPCEIYLQVRMPAASAGLIYGQWESYLSPLCTRSVCESSYRPSVLNAFFRSPEQVLTSSPEADTNAETSALANPLSSAPRPFNVVILSDSPAELEKLRNDVDNVLRFTRQQQLAIEKELDIRQDVVTKIPMRSPPPGPPARLNGGRTLAKQHIPVVNSFFIYFIAFNLLRPLFGPGLLHSSLCLATAYSAYRAALRPLRIIRLFPRDIRKEPIGWMFEILCVCCIWSNMIYRFASSFGHLIFGKVHMPLWFLHSLPMLYALHMLAASCSILTALIKAVPTYFGQEFVLASASLYILLSAIAFLNDLVVYCGFLRSSLVAIDPTVFFTSAPLQHSHSEVYMLALCIGSIYIASSFGGWKARNTTRSS